MQRIASFIVLIAIVGVVGFLAFEVLSGFLLPLFIALLLVVMFRPVHHWLARRLRGRERLAAGITTLCVLLIFLLPLMWFVSRAATDTLALVGEFDPHGVARGVERLRQRFDLESPPTAVETSLADVETALNRLRNAATPAAAFAKEAELRRNELTALGMATTKFIDALWPTTAPAAEDDESKTRDKRLQDDVAEFQDSLTAINKSLDDQARLGTSLRDSQGVLEQVRVTLYGGPIKSWLRQLVKFDETQVTQLHTELQSIARPLAVGTTQFLGSFLLELLIGISVMVVAFYYFLADGPLMTKAIMSLTPLDNRYEVQLLHEFGQLTRAILVAMLLSALVQGVLASVGYALAGFDSIFLLSVLTMVFAIVPFIGAIPIWGSCALWLVIHDGRPQAAAALAAYGIVLGIIGDNLIKPWVLHGRSNLHPLLGLLSVLGGVQALGPIGIVVGPMAVAILQTLLIMVRTELTTMEITPKHLSATGAMSVLQPGEKTPAAGESLVSA